MSIAGLKAEDIEHGIVTWFLPHAPQRSFDRAAREDRAVGGEVAQDHAFASGGEDHLMFAHDIATAERRKADIAAGAGASDPVAAAELCRQIEVLGGLAAGFGLGQGALRGWGKVACFRRLRHIRPLFVWSE